MGLKMKVESAIEAANAAGVAGKVTVAGAGTSGLSFFLSNQFFGLVGAVVAVLGFIVSVYYRRKEYKFKLADEERKQAEERRKEAEHQLRMQQIRGGEL